MPNVFSGTFIQKTLTGFGLWCCLFLIIPTLAHSATTNSTTMQWEASPSSNLGGYQLFYGTSSQAYTTVLDVGNVTSYTVTGLTNGQTYYFAVKAYDLSHETESTFSNEAMVLISFDSVIADFFSTPMSGVAPLTVDFTDSSTGNTTSWAWAFGDGTTSTIRHPSHLYATPGTYAVSLTVTGPNGSATVTHPMIITGSQGSSGNGNRVTAGLVALYEFEEGTGMTVKDTSGVGTPLNLTIANMNQVTWPSGTGTLRVDAETIVSSGGPATKVHTAVKSTNAVTIEAWIDPANLTQNGPARIVSLSATPSLRNLTMAQGVYGSTSDRIEVRGRTTTTSTNGRPAVATAGGSFSDGLHHVVYTRGPAGKVAIYIDTVLVTTATVGGNLSTWDMSMPLVLANEADQAGTREWLGEYHLVAIYKTALSAAQVTQNFTAGPNSSGRVTNQGPTVNAGWDQMITLSHAITLDGAMTDDEQPASATTLWTQQSGPANGASFANATALTTTVSFATAGVYVLQLTADDAEFTSTDTVTITVTAANQPPVVHAGPPQEISLPTNIVTLAGVLTADDGMPASATTLWTQQSGPANGASFANAAALTTTASFTTAGVYVLQLTANDTEDTGMDSVTITVMAANQPPVADAGPPQEISLPTNTVTLAGVLTADDGMPASATTLWTQQSGPANGASFANATALTTTASFTTAGVYVLQLTADDAEFTSTDTVTITVTAANQPPVVDAGLPQKISLPTNTVTLAGVLTADDGVPFAATTSWTLESAPAGGNVTFGDAATLTSSATISAIPGDYVLRLTADDRVLQGTATVTITVPVVVTTPKTLERAPTGSGSLLIPQRQMSVVSVSSDPANKKKVLDGNRTTKWLASGSSPHEMILALGGTYNVTELRYTPYKWTKCTKYEVYVSATNGAWGRAVAAGTWANNSLEKTASFAPKQGAFLRIRYLNPYCYVAEHNVGGVPVVGGAPVGSTTPKALESAPADSESLVIPQSQMSVVSVSSDPANKKKVLDGNRTTKWLASGSSPHEMILALGGTYNVTELRYTPYKWTKCTKYEVYVSTTNGAWGHAVAAGTWANNSLEKTASFAPKQGAFLRIRYLNPYCYVAEHNVGGVP